MNKDDFILKKVSFREDGGLEIEYREKVEKNGQEFLDEYTVKLLMPRHKDMSDAVDKLRIHVSRVFNQITFVEMKTALKLKGPAANNFDKIVDKMFSVIVDNIKMISVTIRGGDKPNGVILSGKRKCLGNNTVVMNTPTIHYENTSIYQQAQELGEEMDKLTNEVYEYIANSKTSENLLDFEVADKEGEKLEKVA